jgi:hypothetical protein
VRSSTSLVELKVCFRLLVPSRKKYTKVLFLDQSWKILSDTTGILRGCAVKGIVFRFEKNKFEHVGIFGMNKVTKKLAQLALLSQALGNRT